MAVPRMLTAAVLALIISPVLGEREDLPNLLLIYPDQWRWDFAGFDDQRADLRLPNLRSFAENGTRFNYAYTPQPWCVPARASMASVMGRDTGNGIGSPDVSTGQDFPLDVPTWYSALRDVGYHTITVGKDDLTQSLGGTSIDGSRHATALGFNDWYRQQGKYGTFAQSAPWDQYGKEIATLPCGLNQSGGANLWECNKWCYGTMGSGKCCEQVLGEAFDCQVPDQVGSSQDHYIDDINAANALALLDRTPAGQPWAMHISFPGPHPPFIITEAMSRSIANRSFPPAWDNQQVAVEAQLRMKRQYAASVENLDRLLGKLLAKVDSMGVASSTLVVITSDHGELLGDHNEYGKKSPFEGSVHVPLIMRGPGVAGGRVVNVPVSTLDVVGTFLDVSHVQRLPEWTAVSLRPLLQESIDESSYLASRPFVQSGLTKVDNSKDTGAVLRGGQVDFEMIIKKINDTHVMKVVCCPTGCPAGNSFAPSTSPHPQLMAFNVAQDPEEYVNLNQTADALALAALLPGRYATACSSSPAVSPILAHGRIQSLSTPRLRRARRTQRFLDSSMEVDGTGLLVVQRNLVFSGEHEPSVHESDSSEPLGGSRGEL